MKKALLPLICLLLCGCGSKIPFTYELREQIYDRDMSEKAVQYYNDQTITMSRVLATGEETLTGGRLKYDGNKRIEVITIPAGTRGVCIDASQWSSIQIKFEKPEDRALLFMQLPGGEYELAAQRWLPAGGLINYGGKLFLLDNACRHVHLQVKKSIKIKVRQKHHVARGVKVK